MPTIIRPPNFSPTPGVSDLAEYLKEVYGALNQVNNQGLSLISQVQSLRSQPAVIATSGAAGAAGTAGASGVMVQLFDQVLSVDTAIVTFSNIVQTSINLHVVIQARSTAAATNDTVRVKFNNDGGLNYDSNILFSNGNDGGAGGGIFTAAENSAASGRMASVSAATSTRTAQVGTNVGDILNYASTMWEKSILSAGGDQGTNANGVLIESISWWHNAAAINRLDFFCAAGSFKAGSRITVYGY